MNPANDKLLQEKWPPRPAPGEAADFVLGLDLGQEADPSALAVLERRRSPGPAFGNKARYAVRYLKRWPLKTAYPAIVDDMVVLLKRPPLARSTFGVDQTGVGKAVVDLLWQALREGRMPCILRPVVITGGSTVARGDDGALHVPKKELVGALQAVLQTQRLLIADLPESEVLRRELVNFQVKLTRAGNETFAASRESDHDDLVMALAIAVWLGDREAGWECPSSAPSAPFAPEQPMRPRSLRTIAGEGRRRLFGGNR